MTEEAITEPKRRGKKLSVDTLPMDEAPQDGKAIWLYEDAQSRIQSVWHNTRRFNPQRRLWESTGFWVKRNSGGVPIPFEPIGWAHIQGWGEEA